MAAFAPLFGDSLKGGEGDVETAASLEGKEAVGLYFASVTCKEFSAELAKAYSEALSAKGFEIVFVSCDGTEEEAGESLKDMPWLAMPFGSKAEKDALVEKYEVQEVPKLVLLGKEGEVLTVNGVSKITEDPSGEGFPWQEDQTPTLSEEEVLVRMGSVAPEPGESGLKGVFINSKNYLPLGFVTDAEESDEIPFSGFKLKPYTFIDKEKTLTEVAKMGFASDWDPYKKEIKAFAGQQLLLMFDPEKTYGEKIIMTTTEEAYNREMERIEAKRQEVMDEFLASLGIGGGGGDTAEDDEAAAEENIVVRDLPRECKEWVSETMEATRAEVSNFTVQNIRPPMQVMITRARMHFGKACKFSDSGENLQNCRPQKDPNFALQRKELEIGIQAVKEVHTCACQTTWFRPVNKSTQYSPAHFLPRDAGLGYDKVDELTEFLTAVSVSVEEALQTNETVDIFQEEFAHLGSEETGDVSKASSNLQEIRTFTDVGFTKGKRVEWIEWVPNSTDMLVSSYCENLHFCDKLENMGRVGNSSILIWSFQDSLAPHCNLVAPWEVTIFKFYPTDNKYVVGGLSSGQLAVWKLSDADLGYALREKNKKDAIEEEKTSAVPSISHKVLSIIDDSHRKAVVAIEWLPCEVFFDDRGRRPGDDLGLPGLLESINDADHQWKPVHKIQLQRQDSGTEMGCCQILYCHDRYDDKGTKLLTNFFASTEEGELIYGDWAAQGGEDRKPEFMKQMFTISKTFRPTLSLERSPFFPDILLAVTDWAFYLWKDDLWKEGIKEPLFQSSYTSITFTRGVWSPTRPSVIFLGLATGGLDIWDFSDQSHKASLSAPVTSLPISSMSFLRHGDLTVDQKLAIGDAGGNTHVHVIPKNLVKQAGKELDNMRKFLQREEQRVRYFQDRKLELGTLKEQIEKQAQMAADENAEDKGKTTVDQDKADAAAEDLYQKLQAECLEELKTM
eukprot:CAMPEP_0115250932 /NCGR_PEP_ID=MMETSP0270-20121206/43367_1 /TAXON_ID=71861 /ORGANISM="Scrippsiella trochoidea, Strain CCMP3099" /LENGTH=957 /DNA_ID=CAMNT_0002666333 /DNA_START=8 /DNA_END=2882 /DNA_ORIENTATION=-